MTTPSPNPRVTPSLAMSLQRWLLGLLLCCGGAIVWTALLACVGSWTTWWLNRDQTYESRTVLLRENGEPVVAVTRNRRNGRDHSVEHQTVDGKPIELAPSEISRTPKSWYSSSFPTSYTNSRLAPHEFNRWIDAPEPFPWSLRDRKSTRLNSSHHRLSRMPSSA